MSRRLFDCEYEGQKVRVMLGYDRPTREVFMQIEQLTQQGQATGELIYASIADPDADADLDYFAGKLESLGINVPAVMFSGVWEDALNQRGNYVVEHFPDNTVRVIYDENAQRRGQSESRP